MDRQMKHPIKVSQLSEPMEQQNCEQVGKQEHMMGQLVEHKRVQHKNMLVHRLVQGLYEPFDISSILPVFQLRHIQLYIVGCISFNILVDNNQSLA